MTWLDDIEKDIDKIAKSVNMQLKIKQTMKSKLRIDKDIVYIPMKMVNESNENKITAIKILVVHELAHKIFCDYHRLRSLIEKGTDENDIRLISICMDTRADAIANKLLKTICGIHINIDDIIEFRRYANTHKSMLDSFYDGMVCGRYRASLLNVGVFNMNTVKILMDMYEKMGIEFRDKDLILEQFDVLRLE